MIQSLLERLHDYYYAFFRSIKRHYTVNNNGGYGGVFVLTWNVVSQRTVWDSLMNDFQLQFTSKRINVDRGSEQ